MEREYKSRLLLLRKWRNIVHDIIKIVKKLCPEAEVYLIGGAAENRITINSAIDIAIIFKPNLSRSDRINVLTRIWEAIDNVVPIYYPLEIHILNINELAKLKRGKIKTCVNISPGSVPLTT